MAVAGPGVVHLSHGDLPVARGDVGLRARGLTLVRACCLDRSSRHHFPGFHSWLWTAEYWSDLALSAAATFAPLDIGSSGAVGRRPQRNNSTRSTLVDARARVDSASLLADGRAG